VSDDLFGLDELLAGRIDILVIDSAILETIVYENTDIQSQIKVIWTIEKDYEKIDITKEVDIAHKPFIVLISGIDIAGSISLRSRSDVNILLVVNPETHKIMTISIPRDTYANLGCKTKQLDKLTHSGIYGVNCTVSTIENLLDIDINYYIRVNFSSVLTIIDVVGNINVYSKYTFVSGGRSYVSGMNTLNAEEALRFSRERHAFENGDIQRGLNQQEVIKGIITKLLQPESLLKIDKIVKAVRKSIDTNVSSTDINLIITHQIENNQPWIFSSTYLKGRSAMKPTYSMGARLLYVYIPDEASLNQLHNDILAFKSETTSGE
jgi:LCP family protein required for cell wall assembly